MDDNASGIHFSANKRNRHMSSSSSASLQSMVGTLSRVNTVASALKRFLSRDGDKGSEGVEAPPPPHRSASSTSLVRPPLPVGSMKITDQVIEEVDEQMTIQSIRPDHRPTVQSIFQPSDPIDMPNSGRHDNLYMRTISTGLPVAHQHVLPPGGVDALLSTSAPSSSHMVVDTKSTEAPTTPTAQDEELDYNVPVDEFELLKARREQERFEKQKATIARTISTAPTTTAEPSLDTIQLMENLSALAKEELSTSTSALDKRKSDIPSDTQL